MIFLKKVHVNCLIKIKPYIWFGWIRNIFLIVIDNTFQKFSKFFLIIVVSLCCELLPGIGVKLLEFSLFMPTFDADAIEDSRLKASPASSFVIFEYFSDDLLSTCSELVFGLANSPKFKIGPSFDETSCS